MTSPTPSDREEAARLHIEMCEAQEAVNEAPDGMPEAEFSLLVAKADQAIERHHDCPHVVQMDYDGEILRCGMTKVPLLDGDELVEDTFTGELFLRSACGLPPRPEMEDQPMLPEMESA